MKNSPFQLALVSIGALSLALSGMAASTGTFKLQTRSSMMGTNTTLGSQGWANGEYSRRGDTTNQILQIKCRGLATNQVYHLMASMGTNGELIHVADFTPDHGGSILMQFSSGISHHFAGTNNPGQAWGMMGGWTNHMSWVVFPTGTNWDCADAVTSAERAQDGAVAIPNGMGGMMGGPGSGGMGGMSNQWPEMTNWSATMTNWPMEMAGWSWNYTNMWNPADNYGGQATNWWGSLGSGPFHMMPLPDSVGSVPEMNGIVVMDANLQPLLVGDLANPDAFVYEVSCTFTNEGVIPGASGSLQAAETQHAAHFMMTASGLVPNAHYYLGINNADFIPVGTDSHGRLRMRNLPGGLTTMRGIETLSIGDQSGNTVLSVTLPPN